MMKGRLNGQGCLRVSWARFARRSVHRPPIRGGIRGTIQEKSAQKVGRLDRMMFPVCFPVQSETTPRVDQRTDHYTRRVTFAMPIKMDRVVCAARAIPRLDSTAAYQRRFPRLYGRVDYSTVCIAE